MDTPPSERQHVFDKPRNVRRVLVGLYITCGIVFSLDLIDLVLPLLGMGKLRHVETDWDHLPGFYAIYGFVSYVVLVLIAKWLRGFLMRKEDYYDQ